MIKGYLIALLFFALSVKANSQTIKPDLSTAKNFNTVNRTLTIVNDNNSKVVHLDAKMDNGTAWINNTHFSTGTIEFDVKGKDVMQQSFVGIAFHGMNDTTYDAVYFRPFNFNSTDAVRKTHCVQYISMPQYDWQFLRQNSPGKYENALTKVIGANSWFHVKIIVDNSEIKAFVNNDANASLTVKPLNKYVTGNIGFWVGNNSDGDFSNLTITAN